MTVTQAAKLILGGLVGSELAFQLTDRFFNMPHMPYVRAVNYHDTPLIFEANLRKQLQWFSKHYEDCNQKQLRGLLRDGNWNSPNPGLLISFDDGLKSNYTVAAPLLEEFGFTGWFMIPVGFLNVASKDQEKFAEKNTISHQGMNTESLAMSWEDLVDLERRGHVITCHSMNHKRLSDALTDEELYEEIILSKLHMELSLGHSVSGFTWVGGEEFSYSSRAFKSIIQAGYSEVFCTNCKPITARQDPLFLNRSNVEAYFPLNQVRMVLGGIYDVKYRAKRIRIFNKLTKSTI